MEGTGLGQGIPDEAGDWVRRPFTHGRVKTEVLFTGTGPAVVMHPALGRSATDFLELGNRVAAAGYRAVAVNPRGIGGSEGPLEEITLEDFADDLLAVVDELELGEVVLLGHGFGGRVTRAATAARPERVRALVLLSAEGEVGMAEDSARALRDVFDPELPPRERLEAVRRACFAPGSEAESWCDGWFSETAKRQLAAVSASPPEGWSEGGTAPMLVVQGLDDRIAPPVNAWELVNRRRGARLVALPDCGHALPAEQPAAVARAVVSFLQERIDRRVAAGRRRSAA